MTLLQIALKAYGQANHRVQCLGMVNAYGKTAAERLDLDKRYAEAISDAVLAKAALDALQGTGPQPLPQPSEPDFNQEVNLHADTIAERHDAAERDSSKEKT